MLRDSKYLLAYILPLTAFVSLYFAGIWSFFSLMFGFILIPILDGIFKGTDENLTEEQEESKLTNRFFDVMLYLNVPILYALVVYYFSIIAEGGLETYELVGMTMSVGLVIGSTGINVAHELGHRTTKFEQFLSKALLLPNHYLHFFIEHNRGHHKNVATPEDPATSRLNESVYAFWIRSVFGCYKGAWNLENTRLRKEGKSIFSLENEMLRYQIIHIIYLAAVGLAFGWAVVPFAILVGIAGFSMLEFVNYIEHYGLVRRKKASGRYENVQPIHSWNSDHDIGRIMLYELTRHSDHHFKATRKYQVLRHFDKSPQLPHGYPGSILLAMIPPLWYSVMNKRVAEHQTVLETISRV